MKWRIDKIINESRKSMKYKSLDDYFSNIANLSSTPIEQYYESDHFLNEIYTGGFHNGTLCEIFDLYLSSENDELTNYTQQIITHLFSDKEFYMSYNFNCLDKICIYKLCISYKLNKNLNLGFNIKNDRLLKLFEIINNSEWAREHNINIIINQETKHLISYHSYLFYILDDNEIRDNITLLLDVIVNYCDIDAYLLLKQYLVSKYNELVESNKMEMIVAIFSLTYFIETDNLELNDIMDKVYEHIDKIYKETNVWEDKKELFEEYLLKSLFIPKLNSEAKYYYVMGNELFEKLENSAFIDYSIISLQFFKVLESFVKNNILKEAMKDLDSMQILEDVKNIISNKEINYDLTDKKKLTIDNSQDWYLKMELGKINVFFKKFIAKVYEFKCEFNAILCKQTKIFINRITSKLLPMHLIEELVNITHPDILKKYRNPPAHMKPLRKDECINAVSMIKTFLANCSRLDSECWDEQIHIENNINNILPKEKQFKILYKAK